MVSLSNHQESLVEAQAQGERWLGQGWNAKPQLGSPPSAPSWGSAFPLDRHKDTHFVTKYVAVKELITHNIPDRETSLAHRPVATDNFPNGKLSKP